MNGIISMKRFENSFNQLISNEIFLRIISHLSIEFTEIRNRYFGHMNYDVGYDITKQGKY